MLELTNYPCPPTANKGPPSSEQMKELFAFLRPVLDSMQKAKVEAARVSLARQGVGWGAYLSQAVEGESDSFCLCGPCATLTFSGWSG